jgi:hypothetical protein
MPGHPMKMVTETTVGTRTIESIVMTAPPVTTALEMMAATGVAVMAMSAQVLQPSDVGS